MFALVNEGFRILEEGIALRPGDIDVVYVVSPLTPSPPPASYPTPSMLLSAFLSVLLSVLWSVLFNVYVDVYCTACVEIVGVNVVAVRHQRRTDDTVNV